MKKEITVAIAALGFISSAVGVYAYSSDDTYICGTAGEQPLVINLEDRFDENIINTQKIKKITFSVDCKTNLDGERAYCNQGIMWYYTDGELNKRSFADIVSVNDPDYELVKCHNCEQQYCSCFPLSYCRQEDGEPCCFLRILPGLALSSRIPLR